MKLLNKANASFMDAGEHPRHRACDREQARGAILLRTSCDSMRPAARGLHLLALTSILQDGITYAACSGHLIDWRSGTLQAGRRCALSFGISRQYRPLYRNSNGTANNMLSSAYLHGGGLSRRRLFRGGKERERICCHRLSSATPRRPRRLTRVSGYNSGGDVSVSTNTDSVDYMNNNHSSTPHQQQQQQQQQQHWRANSAPPEAVVYELEHGRDEQTDKYALGVYGKLHRVLGTSHARRLLGSDAVATMTSFGYLVIHHGDCLYGRHDLTTSKGGVTRSGSGSNLAVGDRIWDVCGDDHQGSPLNAPLHQTESEHETTPAAKALELKAIIENIVGIVSATQILSINVRNRKSKARTEQSHPVRWEESGSRDLKRGRWGVAVSPHGVDGNGHGLGAENAVSTSRLQLALVNMDLRRKIQRWWAHTKATRALDDRNTIAHAWTREDLNVADSRHRNPLALVGMGALLSQEDSEAILREALKIQDNGCDGVGDDEDGAWVPWSGDLGKSARAIRLDDLPDSRALWDAGAGNALRSRIARSFGLHESNIILNTGDVFVCKANSGSEWSGLRLHGSDEATDRGRDVVTAGSVVGEERQSEQGHQQQYYQERAVQADGFRRSKSLITYSVALSPQGETDPAWAVCLEQREECIRPEGVGSGIVFSGKVRHASMIVTPSPLSEELGGGYSDDVVQDFERDQRPPLDSTVYVLRGFVSVCHPRVTDGAPVWRWGSPAWHLDSSLVKDEDILDRIWEVDRDVVNPQSGNTSDRFPNHPSDTGAVSDLQPAIVGADQKQLSSPLPASSPPTISVLAQRGSLASTTDDVNHQFERMNSSTAHRYYRQGPTGGMDIPTRDAQGRPVVDLVETAPRRLPWWFGGQSQASAPGFTVTAVFRNPSWNVFRRRAQVVGRAGFSIEAGTSTRMDTALRELFESSSSLASPSKVPREQDEFYRVPVPPIKYVFVDPRYRGLGLGRRLFVDAMCRLAERGFRFALIVVEDNGTGGLFGFYEEMGFVHAGERLGIPRAMIAPIPPPEGISSVRS